MTADPLDNLTPEQLEKIPSRTFDLYKLRLEERSRSHWENWRHQVESHRRNVDVFNRDVGQMAEYGAKLYHLLLTSMILISGGGMTAIVAAAEGLGPEGIAPPFDWIFRFLGIAILCAFAGGVLGRFATDAELDAINLTDRFPAQIEYAAKPRKRRCILNFFAYAISLLGLLSMAAGICVAMWLV
ncbi:MAG: hypothetical protein U9P68_04870 [Pseudomonadota bacterium]|nr:hypothetical protein [Pseudomonadota bacterium]